MSTSIAIPKQTANCERLSDELELLKLRLLREVRRRASKSQPSDLARLQGLVLSDHEITGILTDASAPLQTAHEDQEIANRVRAIEAFYLIHAEQSLMETLYGVFRLASLSSDCPACSLDTLLACE